MTVADIISSSLLELFVMGQTNESETQQVLLWTAEYPEVAAEIEKIELALEQYALASAMAPAGNVKTKLFNKIANQRQAKEELAPVVTINSNKWRWAAAASFTLFIASGIGALGFFQKYQSAKVELAQLNESKNKTEQKLDVILTSNSEPLLLKGTPYSPTSTAKIFWIKNTGDVYIAPSGLPEAPKGLQYQLWAIIDGKPVDGGMIIKSGKGGRYEIQKMKSFGSAQAFAITLEKEGGAASPSMDKMYVITQGI